MNNNQFSLTLENVHCMKCVGKITTALTEADPDISLLINDAKDNADLNTVLSVEQAIQIISEAGYVASIKTDANHVYKSAVMNVSCQHCVKKITTNIQQLDPNADVLVDIDKQFVQVTSHLTDAEIDALLIGLGYKEAKPEPKAKSELESSSELEKIANSENSNQEKTQEAELSDTINLSKNINLSKTTNLKFALIGVTCASCVNTIDEALKSLSGVQAVNINYANRTAIIQSQYSAVTLIQAIQAVGYDANEITDEDDAEEEKIQREAQEYKTKIQHCLFGLGLGVPLMLYGLLGGSMSVDSASKQLIWLIIGIMTFVVLWQAGKHFFTGAWKAFCHRNANMDTLIALGTGTAWLYSMLVVLMPQWLPDTAQHLYFEASAMIIGLINLGQAFELKARGKTSQAIKRLLDLRVKTAVVIRDGIEVTIPLEDVLVGDHIRVKTGEKIAVDGVILEGSTTIDESMLTGEPMPIEKMTGSPVSAGTINGQGSFIFEAQKVGSDTALAQIIAMVSNAQNTKPPISHLADKVSASFVPAVMIITIITALAWYNFGPQPALIHMIVAATSVLIIACPCALGLATPISTIIGIGKAAEFGGLIRNGDALQKASELDVIVLDKTGTITQGKPEVTNAYFVSDEADILPLVEALEKGSNHPLAQALTVYAQKNKPNSLSSLDSNDLDGNDLDNNSLDISNFESLTGLGVKAYYQDNTQAQTKEKVVLLGNEKLMNKFAIETADFYKHMDSNTAQQWQDSSNTLVYFAVDNEITAIFSISDPLRDDAKTAIERFHQQGIKVVMLTGDNENTTRSVANAVNIDKYYASLMPQDKLSRIKDLQAQGKKVGMAGDGINDAPALAQSDVGFAIGTGTDVAIESADITLMRSSLHGISDIIGISHATMKNIKQNLWGAFIYNSLGIPIAAGLLFPITGWLLSPIIAGVAMSLSSITVVTNANRLRLYTPNTYTKNNK